MLTQLDVQKGMIDNNIRGQLKNMSGHFTRIASLPEVVSRIGAQKISKKQIKPVFITSETEKPQKVKGEKESVKLSKTLSWILRHGAEELGYRMDPSGFILLSDLVAGKELLELRATEDMIKKVVKDCDKQRF